MNPSSTTDRSAWRFPDPPDTAALTTREIVEHAQRVLQVRHDADDGSWQFYPGGTYSPDDARLSTLGELVDRDPSLEELGELPVGWVAVRDGEGQPWRRLAQEDWDREHIG
jgi:hypothetical protein